MRRHRQKDAARQAGSSRLPCPDRTPVRSARRASAALLLALGAAALGPGCGSQNANADPLDRGGGTDGPQDDQTATEQIPVQGYELVETYDHDPKAYTQGLLFADGRLLESTGRYGTSWLREVRLETGRPIRQVDLDDHLFGEGLALHDDELFLLTWRNRTVFVYDRYTFRLQREHDFEGEGWGAVSDGEHIVVSDGTPTLRFFDPETFEEVRELEVTYEGQPLHSLNELELVEGELFANVWKTNTIARIDPETGKVVGWIDLTGLMDFPPPRDTDAVLNGIAYDAEKERLFVTGKLWPRLYEIRLVDRVR